MEDKEVSKALLKAERAKFKFDLDAWKSLVPPSTARGSSEKSAPIPLKWVLQRVVKMKSEYGYPIHSLSSWQKLPYLHQSPMLGQKGVQLRLKGSKRDWETAWRMKCSLLNVSIKGPKAKEVVKTAVANCLQKKNCRLQKPPISTNKDTTSAAILKPVLVDQGTQWDSPAAPLSAEQSKLADEQLQREVYLAKKAFVLPDQDSDSDSALHTTAWVTLKFDMQRNICHLS